MVYVFNFMNISYITIIFLGGLAGVFEIEDLVDVLKKDNASDIFVCSVPKEIKYVDYMCICTGNRQVLIQI